MSSKPPGTPGAEMPSETPSGRTTREARDRALVERLRLGDADALAALYTTYRAALLAIARGFGVDRATAADIVQELFVVVWRDRARFDPPAGAGPYLFVATRNRTLNHMRDTIAREARTARFEANGDLERTAALAPASYNSGETRVLRGEIERAVEQAIESLPPLQRAIYRLHRDAGMSYIQIAGALEISTQTVRRYLITAWDAVAAALEAAGWRNVLRRQRP